MIRAAAKNHADVAVVVDAADYAAVLAELKGHGGATTLALRRQLAAKAYARTAAYDAAIANWFAGELDDAGTSRSAPSAAGWWRRCATARTRTRRRRSTARRKRDRASPPPRQVQGKQLSYNNINDTDAAYECVAEFDPARTAAVVIVKHANPCGVAEGDEPGRRLPQGAALRSGLGVRRHRRHQSHARRRGRARDHRDLHRGDHRAGRRPRRRSPSSAPRRICACWSPAACPIRAPSASP